MLKFKEGDKVHHVDNELIMRVVKYQTKKEKGAYNHLTSIQYFNFIPTGKIICSWVDNENKRQEESFLESELIIFVETNH
jgi:hypothetical protein